MIQEVVLSFLQLKFCIIMPCFKSVNLLVLICLSTCLTVKDFKPAFFHSSQPSAFYNVDTGSPTNGQILCLADINGDKYTDYVATDNRTSSILLVYYWNDQQSLFIQAQFTLNNIKADLLSQVIITDLNADSNLELMATYFQNGSYYSQIYTIVCQGTCKLQIWQIDYTYLTTMTALPFPFDRFANGTVQIFTFQKTNRYLVTLLSNQKSLYSTPWSDIVSGMTSFPTANMHFAAQADVNGDCFADLLMVSGTKNNNLEVYIRDHLNNYQATVYDLQKNITWFTVADFNANGAMDLLIVAYQRGIFSPYILPNQNTPSDICQAYASSSFDKSKLIAVSLPATHKLLKDTNLKVGDFNFDGLPDLLGIFSINSFRQASILANIKGYNFNTFEANLSQLQQINNPIQTSLYDFTENGKLDIIVIGKATKEDDSIAYTRASIVNNIIDDNLFIKVLPLLPSSSSDLSSTSLVGGFAVTIQWRLTNLDGDKTISTINQKTQWNFGSLQPPFATAGLGRTNNYIQDLTVGYPGYGLSSMWTPIIPNSQLIVLQNGVWQLQTLLKDNARVYSMIYISVLCLLLMGLLIVYLNWKERMEDKRDHYNFINMIR